MLLTGNDKICSTVSAQITAQLVDFFKNAFQGQEISVVPSQYGQRILIGTPVLISQTHWHPRMIYSTGKDDTTGSVGFAVFYVEEKRIWNKLDDKFELENLVIFMSIGKERQSPASFSFTDMIKKMPEFSRKSGINILMQDVVSFKLSEYFSRSSDWIATKCGTYGNPNESSFYIKP